jgi:hypothetical protein
MGVCWDKPLTVGDANPTATTILPIFFFPNGGLVFEGVNGILTGGKGFGPVGATDRHEDANFSNL